MPSLQAAHWHLTHAPGDALLSISSPNQAVSPTWLCPPSRMVQQCPTSPGTPLTHGALQSVHTGTSTLPWVAVPHTAAHPLPVSLSACVGAAAGEDAKIRLWRVPEGGLRDTLQEPEAVLRGERGARTQLKNWQ